MSFCISVKSLVVVIDSFPANDSFEMSHFLSFKILIDMLKYVMYYSKKYIFLIQEFSKHIWQWNQFECVYKLPFTFHRTGVSQNSFWVLLIKPTFISAGGNIGDAFLTCTYLWTKQWKTYVSLWGWTDVKCF